jgi:Mg-chelatase subunit ChlD
MATERRTGFRPGPLVEAMRRGAVLVLDEANRLSHEAFAALVPAMSEGEVTAPVLGTVRAAPGFRVVAMSNPHDRTGTGAVPSAFLDRAVRLAVDHPGVPDATAIVAHCVPTAGPGLVRRAVEAVRASRTHPDLAAGSSIRGAIDLCAVAGALAELGGPRHDDEHRAARLALTARIVPAAHCTRTVESLVDELWDQAVLLNHRAAGDRTGRRLPPSVLTTDSGGADRDPAEDIADGSAEPDSGGPSSAGPGGSGRAGGGRTTGGEAAPTDQQPPEMVLRETERALAGLAAASTPPDRPVALGERPGPDELRRLVEAAGRVVVRRLDGARTVRATGSRMAPARYSFHSDDLDLDRTVEGLVGNPLPTWSDIWVRERVPRRRGVVLILDVSGSMRGEPLVHAATAAGAAALALAGSDDLAITAFWRSTAVLLAPGETPGLLAVVNRVLALRPWGLTDVAAGLSRGAELLDRMPSSHRQALVLTDGRANAGADPTRVAAGFVRLDVLATDTSAETLRRCRALATAGHGTCRTYDSLDELPLRLSELLSG